MELAHTLTRVGFTMETLYDALQDRDKTRKARFHPVMRFKNLHPTRYQIRSAKSGLSSA
jgi:hypothetical protein